MLNLKEIEHYVKSHLCFVEKQWETNCISFINFSWLCLERKSGNDEVLFLFRLLKNKRGLVLDSCAGFYA